MSKEVIYSANGVELIENYDRLKISKTKYSNKKKMEQLEPLFTDFDEHLAGCKDSLSNIKWQYQNDT